MFPGRHIEARPWPDHGRRAAGKTEQAKGAPVKTGTGGQP
jgi:hypothetical protein